ncbi:hypothetical protein [Lacinutrix sp. Bg11-31]|uniref:hypothetical protein n=1 Tax=Lacinutrix sp. Bg11-31 TaxID=2057808 RepID=UPI000C308540|nr:hypothetical protein [Lacinutrix sp. Bg11-31]AUC82588.1 hypothetical protein CW733_10805 [Lacinutrix sp. Bg11-31]
MKFLKLTLVAIFSITLLTAVLPSNETEPTVETVNHELSKPSIDLTAFIEIKAKKRVPTEG